MATQQNTKQQAPPVPPKADAPAVKYYLAAYNILSAFLWSGLLILTTAHLLGFTHSSPPPRAAPAPPKSVFSFFFSSLATVASTTTTSLSSKLPHWARPLYERAETTYDIVGFWTKWVQTLAVLEVVHVLLGWVRSPLRTTAMQVASRLFLVWVIADRFPQAQSNPIYACLILSWSTTEIIRYTFYAFSLLSPSIPYPLLYLRYTTFYVLYPTGAASEAFLILSTLPVGKHGWAGMLSGHDMPRPAALLKSWGLLDYARAGLFVFWWFGLWVLFGHMVQLRRKVLPAAVAPPSANGVVEKKEKAKKA